MSSDEDCRFCRIVAGTDTAQVVFADDTVTAFLDVRPLFVGHTLVVPHDHHETLPDLPVGEVGPFFTRVRAITAAVRVACDAAGTFVAMNNTVSQSVPHLHVHVVPRRPKDGLRGFFWPRTTYDDEAHAAATAATIASSVQVEMRRTR